MERDRLSEIGMRIHHAQTCISVSRTALRELMQHEPIDEVAVATTREQIAYARSARNNALRELDSEKAATNPYPRFLWVIQ